jgi:hypothetical protein
MRSFCPDKIDSRPIWQADIAKNDVEFLLADLLRCGRDSGAYFDLMSHSTKDISDHLRGIFMVFE